MTRPEPWTEADVSALMVHLYGKDIAMSALPSVVGYKEVTGILRWLEAQDRLLPRGCRTLDAGDGETVYVSIGNSNDRLGQAEWAEFYRAVTLTLRAQAAEVYGQWVSEPASAWQNACWCVTFDDVTVVVPGGAEMSRVAWVRKRLAELAGDYRQDSVAWAVAPTTEFLAPPGADPPSTKDGE